MTTDTSRPNVAAMFKALGDPTRLRIFEFLRRCGGPVAVADSGEVRRVTAVLPMATSAKTGRLSANGAGVDIPRLSPDGLTVGEICCHVTGEDRISSAISFHLKELRLAGLIQMERRGKNMICSINQQTLITLADYFAAASVDGDCC